jgi:GGDEF domain-containing protein
MVSTSAIAVVARVLECPSQLLLERLRGEVRTDALTGLLSRRGFDEHVLAHIARLLSDEARGIDVAARLGGEEFTVLMPVATRPARSAFAERVRRALAVSPCLDLPEVRVSAGVTATTVPIELELMMDRVDQALYTAKRAGRNRTVAFDALPASLAA